MHPQLDDAVGRDWGNRASDVLRRCIRPLSLCVAAFTAAAMIVDRYAIRWGLDRRQARRLEDATVELTAYLGMLVLCCCLMAAIVAKDRKIGEARPLGRYFAAVVLCLIGIAMIPQIN